MAANSPAAMEALGRHIAALDQARAAGWRRQALLGNLAAALKRAADSLAEPVPAEKLQLLLGDAAAAHADMLEQLAAANRYGQECGRAEVRLARLLPAEG